MVRSVGCNGKKCRAWLEKERERPYIGDTQSSFSMYGHSLHNWFSALTSSTLYLYWMIDLDAKACFLIIPHPSRLVFLVPCSGLDGTKINSLKKLLAVVFQSVNLVTTYYGESHSHDFSWRSYNPRQIGSPVFHRWYMWGSDSFLQLFHYLPQCEQEQFTLLKQTRDYLGTRDCLESRQLNCLLMVERAHPLHVVCWSLYFVLISFLITNNELFFKWISLAIAITNY